VLKQIAARLPADLPATILVTTHVGGGISGRSYMPDIIASAGPLPARHPQDGEKIGRSVIYVAPPDHHMTVEGRNLRITRGPKENMSRPAINPLFRSVAETFGAGAAGLVLTGMLDDGAAGLAEIKRRGGYTVVQDPKTAAYPSMPQAALSSFAVDKIATIEEMPEIIKTLAEQGAPSRILEDKMQERQITITCPECRGPLTERQQGMVVEYECRVGHRYSPLSLKQDHNATIERTIWSLIVAVEEAAEMAESLSNGEPDSPFLREAIRRRAQAETLRAMVLEDQKNAIVFP